MNPTKNYIHLPLKHAHNVRELGGYACTKGQTTRWHAFLRSDNTTDLTEEEVRLLKDYGVRTVIDLRSSSEAKAYPSAFRSAAEVAFRHISLGVDDIGDVTKMVSDNPEQFMKQFYADIITKAGESIKEILETMAQAAYGCILFHCAAGKDRTGIISMLLLLMAGVSRADIISNYQVTFTYIQQDPILGKMLDRYPPALLESRSEYIEAGLDCIAGVYGSMDKYLDSIHINKKTRSALLSRLVE